MSLRYDLPSEVTIYTAAELKDEVLTKIDALTGEEDLIFDCSAVEEIDAAGVQLLLSVVRTSLQENFDLFLENIKPDVKQTLSLVGVKEILLEEENSNG